MDTGSRHRSPELIRGFFQKMAVVDDHRQRILSLGRFAVSLNKISRDDAALKGLVVWRKYLLDRHIEQFGDFEGQW